MYCMIPTNKQAVTVMILSFFIAVMPLRSVAQNLPDMGSSADSILSPAEEQKIGDGFLRNLRRSAALFDDPEIDNYLSALGYRLAAYSEKPEQPFTFFAINHDSINAFAVPGGYIGIHAGLILHTRNEDELASVMAHEVAHVTQRHIARSVESQQRMTIPALAAMIAGIALGVAAGNADIAQAAIFGIQAGSVQLQLNFTRAHEREADRIGMRTLAAAGFDPRSMPIFFGRMQEATRYYEGFLPEFLRSHPLTLNRVSESRDRAEKYPRKLLEDKPLYHLMRAKVLVLGTRDHAKLSQELQESLILGKFRDERAIRYALVLSLLKAKSPKTVDIHLDWLRKHDTDRVMYRAAEAQLEIVRGNMEHASKVFEEALKTYPGDELLSLDYAEHLLQLGQAEKANAVLLRATVRPRPHYYRLLAQSYKEAGAREEAHLALAEFYYLGGHTRLAVEQLRQAQNIKDSNFYLAARVDARLSELEDEMREETR